MALSASDALERTAAYRDSLAHYREHVRKSLAERDYRASRRKVVGRLYAEHQVPSPPTTACASAATPTSCGVSEQLIALVSQSDPAAGMVLDNGADSAHSMHAHFHENDLPDATVIRRSEQVADAIDLLQALFSDNGNDAAESQPEATT